jgi:2,3-bisphosphoglycerate-dependent phosphoglycerate mutase
LPSLTLGLLTRNFMILYAATPANRDWLNQVMTDENSESKTRFRTVVVFAMLFAVLGAVVVFGYFVTFRRPVTTIIIVRHAEKIIDPNNNDVDLNEAGQARAREIARVFGDAGINAIYATQYKRTQETVKPLADRIGVPITIVNSKNTNDLAAQIRAQHSGQTIFIAGHNNSVPEIIAALGGPQYPTIPESEYDNLFVVTVYRTGKAKVVKMKYGSVSQ